MTYTLTHEARTAAAPVPRGRRWRRRIAGGVVLVLALAGTAKAARYLSDDSRRNYLSTDGWPRFGEGAYEFGDGTPHLSARQTPVPIASLAKVMTAYLVLSALPLRGSADGPPLLVTSADVLETARRRAQDQSVVPVKAGERLTERQALMALLLPSANNVAMMITRYTSDTPDAFVARMNATARRLGMWHTHYTDPSGFDERTRSTAADQLMLARVAAADPTLAAMTATRSYRIPVAGTVHNTDLLLGRGGFVGMKTGSDDAAGGCFMFRVRRRHGTTDLYGVVLGQQGENFLTAGLYSGRQLADRVLSAGRKKA